MDSRPHLEQLAIFPLERATLFPHALLPLHIFEPRYRQMTADCLREGRPMAIAMIDRAAGEVRPGVPAVRTTMGVGVIEEHSRLEDGRYHIVLRGTGRVRMVEELPQTRLYREGRAEPVLDSVEDFGRMAEQMDTLRACLHGIQRARPDLASALAQMAPPDGAPGAIVDRLATSFFPEPELRQQLMEQPVVDLRVRTLVERVGEVLARISGNDPGLLN